MQSKRLIAIILCVAFFVAGCAGPSKLGRALDQNYNQIYVDSPIVAELLLPLILLGSGGALIVDLFFVNPVYWWKDALDGQGTPYYYRPPIVEPLDELPE